MNTTRAIVILAFTLCLAAANAQNVPTGNSTANPRTSAQSQPSDAMADCPLHAQHMAAKDDARHQNVDQRGDQAMGFDHSKTTHHFLQREDGGIIQVTADNAADRESIAAIRGHLAKIAQLFATGDFNIPMFVHDQVPPGVVVAPEAIMGELFELVR